MVFKYLDEIISANSKIFINLRNNCKFICRIKKYDKHFNMIIYDAILFKIQKSKNRGVKKREDGHEFKQEFENKEIYIRGDNVISISDTYQDI